MESEWVAAQGGAVNDTPCYHDKTILVSVPLSGPPPTYTHCSVFLVSVPYLVNSVK